MRSGSPAAREIASISYEVKASEAKVDFIENYLPALVGDGVFWMDTLTVDQGDEKEILAIVQSIPIIFMMAKRVIAVRGCNGLYNCCMKAVEGFCDFGKFGERLYKHSGEHDK